MKKVRLDLVEEMDKLFPKGDKARGRALVLVALANLRESQIFHEIEKLEAMSVKYEIIGLPESFRKIKKKWRSILGGY